MAGKSNKHPDEIDLTPFDFISIGPRDEKNIREPGCGGCHPGGGMAEYDRDGRRYDRRLREDPSLAGTLDGDYFQSQWDKTGVVEADCLFCHLPRYNAGERNIQLKMLNFQWATVVASGIGLVSGYVRNGEEPQVTYNRRLFNENGHIVLPLQRPAAENCNLCHGWIDMAKRGTHWGDKNYIDVHKLAGMTCIDCHFGDLDHNFAKGDESISNVRADLDNTMLSCGECHDSGYMGATRPAHKTIRAGHLDKIGCPTCHIPRLERSAVGAMVMTTGPPVKYPQWETNEIGSEIDWRPAYELRKKGRNKKAKIWPVNPIIPIKYTNLDKDGIYYPLFVREIAQAHEKCRNDLSARENKLEIKTDDDITIMLTSLTRTLANNQRFSQTRPHFHKGKIKYFLDDDNRLKKEEDDTWVTKVMNFSVSHNVALSRDALGAGGCKDCHAKGAHLFEGKIITDMFGPDGQPVTREAGNFIGFDALTFKLNYWFQSYLYIVMPILMIALTLLILFLLLRCIFHIKTAGLMWSDGKTFTAESSFGWRDVSANIFRLMALLLLLVAAHILFFAELGMLGMFASAYNKFRIIAVEVSVVLFIAAIIFYIMALARSKPSQFHGLVHRVAFQIANISAFIMVITGALLFFKENWSSNTNLFLAIAHGLTAIFFLGAIIIYIYKNLSSAIKRK